jgi:hypothetical protein
MIITTYLSRYKLNKTQSILSLHDKVHNYSFVQGIYSVARNYELERRGAKLQMQTLKLIPLCHFNLHTKNTGQNILVNLKNTVWVNFIFLVQFPGYCISLPTIVWLM